jgi:hypothetical protein
MEDKTTHGFIILDEDKMKIIHQLKSTNGIEFKTEPRIWSREEDANTFASERLEMWSIIEINFKHRFIHHEVNQQSMEVHSFK